MHHDFLANSPFFIIVQNSINWYSERCSLSHWEQSVRTICSGLVEKSCSFDLVLVNVRIQSPDWGEASWRVLMQCRTIGGLEIKRKTALGVIIGRSFDVAVVLMVHLFFIVKESTQRFASLLT